MAGQLVVRGDEETEDVVGPLIVGPVVRGIADPQAVQRSRNTIENRKHRS